MNDESARQPTLDFASSLYLGWRHSSQHLPGWASLSTGVPAAFEEPREHRAVGQAVAQIQGLEAGLVAPSTLHLFFDWFGLLDPRCWAIFADEHLYRVGQWGVERAAGRGVPTFRFRHQCTASLRQFFLKKLPAARRPIVVTDGWCPICGQAAPLCDYLALLEPLGGLLVLDDTQAMGVLGRGGNIQCPTANVQCPSPHGKWLTANSQWPLGGSGLLRHLGIRSERVLSISSLAKAFGAPLAVLAGSERLVADFRERSETRVYAGQPSATAVQAAARALALNCTSGDTLRERLFRNVVFFKKEMAALGLCTQSGFFPAQIITNLSGEAARRAHHALARQGIRTVLVADHSGTARLCFLVTAEHTPAAVGAAARITAQALQTLQRHDNNKSIQMRHLAPPAGLHLPNLL